MILIGQYDSSYTRRVAIALRLHGIGFEQRPWSVGRDAELIRPFNPTMRVPTLVLDDGEALVETFCILDYVDGLVEPERRLWPQAEPARRRAMRVAALATSVVDLTGWLFYLRAYQAGGDTGLAARRRAQVVQAMGVLEGEFAGLTTPFRFGAALTHADIAVAASLRHARESNPREIDWAAFPALGAFCARLEAMAVFQEISQPFVAPV